MICIAGGLCAGQRRSDERVVEQVVKWRRRTASACHAPDCKNSTKLLRCGNSNRPMPPSGQNAKNSNGTYLVRCCPRKRMLERTCPLVAFVADADALTIRPQPR